MPLITRLSVPCLVASIFFTEVDSDLQLCISKKGKSVKLKSVLRPDVYIIKCSVIARLFLGADHLTYEGEGGRGLDLERKLPALPEGQKNISCTQKNY